MSSFIAKPAEIERKWYVIDAEGKNLGRMASQIAAILRGKNKPTYTPHVDTGDYVIILNAGKIEMTGNKEQDKIYYRHTGHVGNMKSISAGELKAKNPVRLLETSIKGMLPKNSLGRTQLGKLFVYADDKHPHEAQQPESYTLRG